MPVKTNTKKKNKKVTKKISNKNSIFSWKRLIILVAIVLVGSVAVFAFAEQQPSGVIGKKRSPGNLEASFVQSKPAIVEKNEKGEVKVISSGRSIFLSKDGIVYCTPENSNSTTSLRVSVQDAAKVRSTFRSSKIDNVKSETIQNQSVQLGSYKSIAADSNGVQKELKVFENNAETPEFKSAVSSLEALCVKAVTPIPNIDVPSFAPADPNTPAPATSSKPNVAQKVAQAITPKVSALYGATLDPNFENIMRTKIDGVRAANGRSKLNRSPCLDNAAREYSSFMAQNNFFAHSDKSFYGSILYLPEKYCGTIYGTVGENVGKFGTAETMFTAYMNSPGHAANILGDWTFMGIGTYIQSGTNVPFNTQIFMKCTTCGAAAQSSY